jgi:hypothetical protein
MKKTTATLAIFFCCINCFSQKDSVEVMFAYKITDYTVKLNDSVTIVQVNLPDAWPVSIHNKQLAILKHHYENGTIDTALVGWGRCNLIKGDYYYFTINRNGTQEPKQGDLLYTKCKTPPYYRSSLFDVMSHSIDLTDVYENQFYHSMDIFSLNSEKEKAILDSMIADIRFTGNAMKKQTPEKNQLVAGGLFDGKKLFDAMEITTRKEFGEFLKYIVARPQNYAGNTWKISEIFATWIISKSPQVTQN